MSKINSIFWSRPFVMLNDYHMVFSDEGAFVFQFDMDTHINKYELCQRVIGSLNSYRHTPIEELTLTIDYDEPMDILNNGTMFIRIRGWSVLTGISGYNLSEKRAFEIQLEFRDWILQKLTTKQP